jgi:hypothetical protein
MASQLLSLFGSKLQRKNPSTGVFEDVPQMVIVPVPSATQNYLEGTNHDSPGRFEENEPGIKTGDEIPASLRYHYDIALHVQLFNDFVNQTKLTWRALFPGGVHGYEFEARIARWGYAGGGFDYNAIATLETALKVTAMPAQF